MDKKQAVHCKNFTSILVYVPQNYYIQHNDVFLSPLLTET